LNRKELQTKRNTEDRGKKSGKKTVANKNKSNAVDHVATTGQIGESSGQLEKKRKQA